MEQINIWGIKINPLTKSNILEIVDNHIAHNDSLFQLTGVNPETISHATQIPELRQAIYDSEIVNIDNMLVTTCLRLLHYKVPERAACTDIFELLLELAEKKGYTVYFLGASQDVIDKMKANFAKKYPDLKILKMRNGYFKQADEAGIVEEISTLSPDMLFVGLPTPQKEVFIHKYKNVLNARFAQGVGGAFDCMGGKVNRAPKWMQRIGLEGIHRTLQNPHYYGKRYKVLYLPFLKMFLKEIKFHLPKIPRKVLLFIGILMEYSIIDQVSLLIS
ncbi:MAG TPA: WecB/TagA/CpsF family glycosyltransferase [Bacteroidales bacterium]|nr:WecB/TagA/CpsF family glycosyltransferase [Bacteroidales bacterium]